LTQDECNDRRSHAYLLEGEAAERCASAAAGSGSEARADAGSSQVQRQRSARVGR